MVENKPRRNTRQRQVVLEELRKLCSHPTAAELYELARQRLPKISLGTVYRNLELLVQMGVIRKLETAGSEARFDADVDQHYHVRCVQCHRVDDVEGLPPDPVKKEALPANGYDIVGLRLEFIGICPSCQEDSTSEDCAESEMNENKMAM
ncbi:MAG: transcriptional repressor [Phycisphaerae bacterium]|jgi:Fur family ferric uptake transcriptional regulator